ncbi:EF-hand domain-containing protein [Solidesulfovibrio sp.]|uniref:EF-hand domain-containing protein n=1 Tax=Solidesulfovibrio sp. TaxID=2910990 RepID=UPI0026320C18|nr:EF-hand domain-containing protein [Solidesulfovibrio sp.]
MEKLRAVACCLALAAGLCAGCAGESRAPSGKAVQTSYPSPDYNPDQAGPPASPSPAPPASVSAPAPQGRPLYGPVGQTAPAAAAPAAAPAGVPAQSPAIPPARAGRPAGAPNMNRLFDAMDADRNGRVTLEEWRNFHEKEFRRLDKNDDGVLTREEMAAPPPMAPGGAAPRPAP